MNSIGSRLKKIQSYLKANRIGLAIISLRADIAYLTQVQVNTLEREAMLYVSPIACVLLHSPLLKITPSPTFATKPALTSTSRAELLSQLVSHPTRVGIQESDVTVSEYKSLKDAFKKATFVDVSSMCTQARSIKSATEIATIQKAGGITASVMDWVLGELGVSDATSTLLPHVLTHQSNAAYSADLQPLSQSLASLIKHHALSEIQLAQHIGMALSLLGSNGLAFPVHVAFDEHTAAPHHQPGNKIMTPHSVVMLDFGAKVDGYCADMTRTFCLSPTPAPAFVDIKKVADLAYESAGDALHTNQIIASAVDAAARNVIAKAGYAAHFPHSTGHGLGLDIHEQPSLAPSNRHMLKAGMVVTIEPGIYLEGQFGYRIEDTLLIT